MSSDFIADADTTVFWDVEDFPVDSLDELRWKIGAALEKIGYPGEVSIKAYGEKKPDDDELIRYKNAGITFVRKGEKYKRVDRMKLDIAIWTLDQPQNRPRRPDVPMGTPENLMVISKFIPRDPLFPQFLEDLSGDGYNVLLVVPCNIDPKKTPVPEVNRVWYWESLFQVDGGEPISPEDLAPLVEQGLLVLEFRDLLTPEIEPEPEIEPV